MSNNKKMKNLPQKTEEKKKYQWTKKKIIAASIIGAAVLSFIIFMVIAIVLQLGPIRPIKSSEEEARVVGVVEGYEVRYEELRYVTLLHRQSLEIELGKYEELDGDGKAEFDRLLRERVLSDIENNYVILSLCDKYGIDTDSKKAKNYVQDALEAFVEENFDGSREKYKKWLAENNMTDAFLRLTYKTYYLETVLLDHFVENKIDIEYDATTKNELVLHVLESEDWARTIHAFYPKTSDYVDVSHSKENAEAVVSELRGIKNDGDRYSAMCSAIGRAPFVSGFSVTGNGIYFTYGQLGDEYDSVAFALEEYGVSDVLETEDGYYVIMRLPKEEAHVRAQADTLLTQYRYAALKKHMDAQKEKLAFEGNEFFDSLNIGEID